jgi:hypothetical protein
LHWTQVPVALQTVPPLSLQAVPWDALVTPHMFVVQVLTWHLLAWAVQSVGTVHWALLPPAPPLPPAELLLPLALADTVVEPLPLLVELGELLDPVVGPAELGPAVPFPPAPPVPSGPPVKSGKEIAHALSVTTPAPKAVQRRDRIAFTSSPEAATPRFPP